MSAHVETVSHIPQIVKLVESARKVKAPIAGIPIPGERPFCVKADLLRDSLKGMQIVEASIQRPLPGTSAKPYLLLYAVTEDGVKGTRKYYPYNGYFSVLMTQTEWADKQRGKVAKPKLKGKAAKAAILIRKLEKEKQALSTYRPRTSSEYRGEYFQTHSLQYHREKQLRKALSKIHARVHRGLPKTEMYSELDNLFGTRVKRFSELNTRQKEIKAVVDEGILGYLKTPELFGLDRKIIDSYLRSDYEEDARNHRDYLYAVSTDIRRRVEIDAMIADLKATIQ